MNNKFKQGSEDDYLKSDSDSIHPQTSECCKFGGVMSGNASSTFAVFDVILKYLVLALDMSWAQMDILCDPADCHSIYVTLQINLTCVSIC